jgi:hypothetical protein
MNIDSIEKKLREAQFFLGQMREQERRAFGDREPFDFFLSAFLSAVRTVDYVIKRILRRKQNMGLVVIELLTLAGRPSAQGGRSQGGGKGGGTWARGATALLYGTR